MKWCKHLDNAKVRFSIFRCSGDMWNAEESTCDINFCPLCGTPRPKEKSLEEKFMECRATYQPFSDFIDEQQANLLVKIATSHFKEQGK